MLQSAGKTPLKYECLPTVAHQKIIVAYPSRPFPHQLKEHLALLQRTLFTAVSATTLHGGVMWLRAAQLSVTMFHLLSD